MPDLWQQQAVRALRAGRDVVVHAPTGAGKTLIFELLHDELRGQAVFTVPTRALANDKLAEWRARGWDVGISTGDVAERLDAKILVATLEAQKQRLIEGKNPPALFVVDEYQMIADPIRGVHYELAVALAHSSTQLLLLSGSVANAGEVADWLRRLGRETELVSTDKRPVPLTEVDLEMLPDEAPSKIRGYWPRRIANALIAGLGPVLLFAPRRRAAEELAQQLANGLPPCAPLKLTTEQEQLAGAKLARLLQARVAWHHSGLSYAQRAHLIEPLAKRGELRAVVATMGLAAGINFSMRSVLVTAISYRAGRLERRLQSDELLQMFGRAGRRGLDDAGYALITMQPPRLNDASPKRLARSTPLDWPSLLGVMRRAPDPLRAAVKLNRRLFCPQPPPVGFEHSLSTGPQPCGIMADMGRARFVRRAVIEMLDSRQQWSRKPERSEKTTLGEVRVRVGEKWRPALSVAALVQKQGRGALAKSGKLYVREVPLGIRADGGLKVAPWLREHLGFRLLDADGIARLVTELPKLCGGKFTGLFPRGEQLFARFDDAETPVTAWRDRHGALLVDPPERSGEARSCDGCGQRSWCSTTGIVESPAEAWLRLGLIKRDGTVTRRGIIFSFFLHAEGLAIAAGLECEDYPIEDLVFDLANLRAGPRFSEEDAGHGGRLGSLCAQAARHADFDGYLALGVPLEYGDGAAEVIRNIVEHGVTRSHFVGETLRLGDIERALLEWRSLLRHIAFAPAHPWDRWTALQAAARERIG